ncbi:MAG: hypothetical protein JNM39_16755 [Bdellovibrionaceae bacterium]|nr:hypothetical protein [Pseudobdellovibrionaceae bacterium]
MFNNQTSILELIKLLQSRKVSLYHACQLKDLQSYLKLGGVPARGLMTEAGLPFTSFKSDENDQESGDWNRVFLNMNDFGNFFHSAKGSKSTPNIYGPILLKLDPDCIEDASDVAVCLCSAGSSDYDRTAFSLKSTDEVNQLFQHPSDGTPKSSWLKQTPDLKKTFSHVPVKGSPEISCTVDTRLIKLDYLTAVMVDPLSHSGCNLIDSVTESLRGHDKILGTMVKRTTHQSVRYNALVKAVAKGPCDIKELTEEPDLSEWAKNVIDIGLSWQFDRFATYLREGTISLLETEKTAA